MSETSFRQHFIKTGLVPLARIGGVDFCSFIAAHNQGLSQSDPPCPPLFTT
jgi:hypothetical protein